MKIEVMETEKKKKYPYVGATNSGKLVLFTAPDTGVQINDSEGLLGEYSDVWSESRCFTPFIGTITLSND